MQNLGSIRLSTFALILFDALFLQARPLKPSRRLQSDEEPFWLAQNRFFVICTVTSTNCQRSKERLPATRHAHQFWLD